jgi:NAD(P)-dependent dehydrogenase (short-subunit alcohol dehydrogenase family)
MRFADRVVVVTGAASGVGRECAKRFAAEGAAVVGFDVNESGLAETVAVAEAAVAEAGSGGTMWTRRTDIASREDAHAAIDEVAQRHGRLDVLANVAGVLRCARVPDVTEADWDLVFGVNVAGTFWCCQAAIPHLIESRGNIVNVASNAGLMGQAYFSAYTASKAAVVNLTRSLAMEYVKAKIRINAVAPGGIDTPMTAGSVLPDDVDWKLVEPYMGHRRLNAPASIANVICFVASDEASAMHGSIVSADSGLTAG